MEKISIITVTFNCVDEIEDSIKSYIDQDYTEKELIVIDGASTDGTVDIIRRYEKDIAYWVSEPDKGLYYAMNKGIENATGDWIYIHNAGNQFYDKYALSNVFNRDLSGIDAVYGYIYSRSLGKILRNPKPFYEYTDIKKRMMGFSHQAIFIRRNWAKKYPYDTLKYRCCADYNQMVQIYNDGARFAYVDVAVCRSAPAGFSKRNRLLQFRETAMINGLYGSMWYYKEFFKLAIKHWIKSKLYGT